MNMEIVTTFEEAKLGYRIVDPYVNSQPLIYMLMLGYNRCQNSCEGN